MPELNLINPYCYKYCTFNTGLIEGIVVGMALMSIVFICIKIINNINGMYKGSGEDEEEIEVEAITLGGRKYWRDIKSNTLYTNEEGDEPFFLGGKKAQET